MEQQRKYEALVERHRETILKTERHIWCHPETGFREWQTQDYLAQIFQGAGYTLHFAGDIPGFYADLDTGRPGPRVVVFGEMDCLLQPGHPEAVDGRAHSCGHHTQCAMLTGVALALREPGALDGLSGSIRLMAVPAEERIEEDYRRSLQKQGVIRYMSGKVEFLRRGYLDGCDICLMLHAGTDPRYLVDCWDCNGCMEKEITFEGVAAHAGAAPQWGINALYAATLGLQAINSLRETFHDGDHIRVHPIMTEGGQTVNTIPARTKLSTFIRGASLEAIGETGKKVTRAVAGAALAMGAKVHVSDSPGYAPLVNDPGLVDLVEQLAAELVGADKVNMHKSWGCASTDMGDMSCVMRAIHPHIGGCTGACHGDDFQVPDPETTCVLGAKLEVLILAELLKDGAARAKEILAGPPLRYPNKEAYFKVMDSFQAEKDLIAYTEDGAKVQL